MLSVFALPGDAGVIVTESYDTWLVVLSILIAVFAGSIAMQIAGQATAVASRSTRAIALLSASVSLGGGIWAMHFIGMLALSLCTPVTYNPSATCLSLLPGIGASALALALIRRPNISTPQLLFGGAAVGGGIGAMHYTGMSAMQMDLSLRYDPIMFAVSIVVAVALAQGALWVRFGLHSLRSRLSESSIVMISGGLMGLAIAGMHYTGMAAARFVGPETRPIDIMAEPQSSLALAVALIVVLITFAVLGANSLLRYRDLVEDLRTSEARQRESEAQFRSLIGNLPGTAYRSLVADGLRTIFVSDAIEALTGYPPADFVTPGPNRRRIFDLAYPDDKARVHAEVTAALSEGRNFQIEARLIHKDGSIRWAWGYGRGVPDANGETKWLDGLIFDITERRRAEAELLKAKERAEQAAASQAAFVAKMSHEIRTPINAILGFTDVLLGSALGSEQRRHLQTVRTAGRSLLLLLNDVLDTAKLERGAMELELADFNLRDLAEELIETISVNAAMKGIEVKLGYAGMLRETFNGDALRIRQVLTNILGNAVKFTEHGSVQLAIQPDGDSVHFAIRDTGIGIPPERLEYIFDPFMQADASMSRRFGGSGLGTTISRQLVELMKGEIWAESEVGRGSTFHVRLPLAPAVGREKPASEAIGAPRLSPLRILVVDDAEMNAELMTIMLGREGHRVTALTSGAEAISVAAANSYDVILMDLMMPGIDGLEATRKIRIAETEQGRGRTPIVALSASVLEADREAAREAGMDGFASKPVEYPVLSRVIAETLRFPARAA